MQRTTEFNMIVNEISAKVEARYFTQRVAGGEHGDAAASHRFSVDTEDVSS